MGRGRSGKGNAERANGSRNQKNADWRKEYDELGKMEQAFMERAEQLHPQVIAAKEAYHAAPTRSKVQKQRAAELEAEYNRLSMEENMLRYRAAQAGTAANAIRMENDTRYRNKRDREAAREARLNYR